MSLFSAESLDQWSRVTVYIIGEGYYTVYRYDFNEKYHYECLFYDQKGKPVCAMTAKTFNFDVVSWPDIIGRMPVSLRYYLNKINSEWVSSSLYNPLIDILKKAAHKAVVPVMPVGYWK